MQSEDLPHSATAAAASIEQRLQGADCLCLTGTGFTGLQRQQVRHLADAAGCEYRGDLVFGRTTHLIFRTHASALQGSKVQTAQQWGIPIVHWQWLLDSVSRGTLQDVRPYQLGCGTAAHLLSAGLQALPLQPSPVMQAAGTPAVACSTAAEPSAQPPPIVLDIQHPQLERQLLYRSGISPPTAATPVARSPGAHAPAELMSGSARRADSLHATPTGVPLSQEDPKDGRQPGCAEHWRRALGNITNRRRPHRKQRISKQHLAMPQLQLLSLSPVANSAVIDAHQYCSSQRSCSKDAASAVLADRAQHVALPAPERPLAAACTLQPLQPVVHSRESMTQGAPPTPAGVNAQPDSTARLFLQQSPAEAAGRGSSPEISLADLPAVSPCSTTDTEAEQQGHRSLHRHGSGRTAVCTATPPRADVRLWGLQPMPLGSSALRHHQLPAGACIPFYRYLKVATGDSERPIVFDLQDQSHAALMYYDDVSDASGACAHTLVYAGLLAACELRGEAWLEHCYFYDRDDIWTDRRGKGRGYLRKHVVRDHELIASPYVYHSRASAIEGQFRLFHSHAAWVAAVGSAHSSSADDSADVCDAAHSSSGSAAAAQGAGPSMLAYFCERGWDRCTGRPWLMR